MSTRDPSGPLIVKCALEAGFSVKYNASWVSGSRTTVPFSGVEVASCPCADAGATGSSRVTTRVAASAATTRLRTLRTVTRFDRIRSSWSFPRHRTRRRVLLPDDQPDTRPPRVVRSPPVFVRTPAARTSATLASVTLAALLLAGCGHDDDPSVATPSTAPTSAAPSSATPTAPTPTVTATPSASASTAAVDQQITVTIAKKRVDPPTGRIEVGQGPDGADHRDLRRGRRAARARLRPAAAAAGRHARLDRVPRRPGPGCSRWRPTRPTWCSSSSWCAERCGRPRAAGARRRRPAGSADHADRSCVIGAVAGPGRLVRGARRRCGASLGWTGTAPAGGPVPAGCALAVDAPAWRWTVRLARPRRCRLFLRRSARRSRQRRQSDRRRASTCCSGSAWPRCRCCSARSGGRSTRCVPCTCSPRWRCAATPPSGCDRSRRAWAVARRGRPVRVRVAGTGRARAGHPAGHHRLARRVRCWPCSSARCCSGRGWFDHAATRSRSTAPSSAGSP